MFGILAEFGALLGPGSIKTALIEYGWLDQSIARSLAHVSPSFLVSRLIDIIVDAINRGDASTMGKWALRALVPIVGSNDQQLEHIITHSLFGKVGSMPLHSKHSRLLPRLKHHGGQRTALSCPIAGYY